jgi:ABC-type branched-subunit amino acid transport system substrate-binding protein
MTTQASSETSDDGQYGMEESEEGRKRRLRRQRRKRIAIGAILGLVLVSIGTTAGLYATRTAAPAPPGPPCASCLSIRPANAAMRQVLDAIDKENSTVRADTGRPWVSVVLLTPLTPAPGSDVTLARMVDELRGAYEAQRAMDGPTGPIGIQLLVDNEGTSREGNEGPAVRQLLFMAAADHVVAVLGPGVSNAATDAAATVLDRHGMPMFGYVTSADRFSGPPSPGLYPGMVQIIPDVTAQVSQLARELGQLRSTVLVYDSSTDDYYTSDLYADFRQKFAASLTGEPQPYTPGENPNSQFRVTAEEVCSPQQTPVILYAGRQIVLSAFISQLMAYGGCAGKNLTIVTGGDGDGLPSSSTADHPGDGQVSVVYSDVVDLGRLTESFRNGYSTDLAKIDPGATGLGDTWLVTAYDAMNAAGTAIQQAYTDPAAGIPTRAAVLTWVDRLNEVLQVPGATGPFSLDNHGRLVNFTVPVYVDTHGQRVPFTSDLAAKLGLR